MSSKFEKENDKLNQEIDEFTKSVDKHVKNVYNFYSLLSSRFDNRMKMHDNDKKVSNNANNLKVLKNWLEISDRLSMYKYGTDEYFSVLREILSDHSSELYKHYKKNSNHPEYYDNEIERMNLFDLMEMIIDWFVAATTRTNSSGIISGEQMLSINAKRFPFDKQLSNILSNTIDRMIEIKNEKK